MRALSTAATGMMAMELNVQVISNNLANMTTTGYKRQRAEFQDLLYDHVSRIGTQTSAQGNILPVGIDLGSGVKTVGTPRLMTQGTLTQTNGSLDLAIRGEGFFKIQHARRHLRLHPRRLVPDGRARPHRHRARQRRAARDHHSAERHRPDHQRAGPGLGDPAGLIDADGARPAHAHALRQPGRPACRSATTCITETPASGTPQDGLPATDGAGDLQQGNLEQSNVDSVTEITNLIAAQRAYEMNSKVISAADQMLSTTSNLMR